MYAKVSHIAILKYFNYALNWTLIWESVDTGCPFVIVIASLLTRHERLVAFTSVAAVRKVTSKRDLSHDDKNNTLHRHFKTGYCSSALSAQIWLALAMMAQDVLSSKLRTTSCFLRVTSLKRALLNGTTERHKPVMQAINLVSRDDTWMPMKVDADY